MTQHSPPNALRQSVLGRSFRPSPTKMRFGADAWSYVFKVGLIVTLLQACTVTSQFGDGPTRRVQVLGGDVDDRTPQTDAQTGLPEGFVYLADTAPSVVQDMRYVGSVNFVGTSVDGYLRGTCILAAPAAAALARVQADVARAGYTLVVHDCYRPQMAVDHFVRWSSDGVDATKDYYPNLPKDQLFQLGYIARKSGHSRGSTVDLSLRKLGHAPLTGNALTTACTDTSPYVADPSYVDMGSTFDCLDTLSNTADPRISAAQRSNRAFLVGAMAGHGFSNYDQEWWHFTFRPEAFPESYFNFPVE